MELNLVLSGVPNGEDYWGPSEDAPYFHTKYTTSQENQKFDIQLRHNDYGCHVYYHYLVYNIVNSSSGRTGSYIGITLRLDSFCKDFLTIYQLLDMAFRKSIIDVFLQEVSGGRLQYMFDSFKEKEAELKKLEENIANTLGLLLKPSDIIQISSVPQSEGYEKINLNEASSNDIKQFILQKKMGCSLSLEYESKRGIKLLQNEYQRGANSRQAEIEQLSIHLKSSKDQNDSLKSQMDNLNVQNTHLKKSIEQLQIQKNKLEQSICNNAVGYIRCSECHNNKRTNAFVKYLQMTICVFCLLALAYSLYNIYTINKQTQPLNSSIENIKQNVESINVNVDSLLKRR